MNTEASLVELIYRKTVFFQHIIRNNFRQMRLKYENFSCRGMLFQKVKRNSDFKSFIAKTFNENVYLFIYTFILKNKKKVFTGHI